MKRQVQQTGIREWFGDDFLEIQNESLAAIEAHYATYGSCIIKGCEVSGNNIAAGIVFIEGKVQRFLGAEGLTFPCYLKTSLRKETREYQTGGSKDVAEIYEAVISPTVPAGDYITITSLGGRTFRQAFQDANNRMVSDSKIAEWNAARSEAASDVRGGVSPPYNTLKKLYDWIVSSFAKKSGDPKVWFYSMRSYVTEILRVGKEGGVNVLVKDNNICCFDYKTGAQMPLGLNYNKTILANWDGSFSAKDFFIEGESINRVLTQSEYDKLSVKNPKIVYYITD